MNLILLTGAPEIPAVGVVNVCSTSIGTGNRDVIDFGEIVIVSRQPEDGYSVHSRLGCFFRKLYCRKSLIDRKCRSTENTNLLPRYNGDGAFAKAIQIPQSLRRNIPRLILAFENCGNAFSAGIVVGYPNGLFFHPLCEIRGSGIKRLDFGGVGQEISEKAGRMWDLRKRKTVRLH